MKTRHYLLLLHFLIGFSIPAQNGNFEQVLDSIQHLRKLSEDESLNLNTRLQHAKKASALSYKTKVDSTILLSNRYLLSIYLKKIDIKMIGKLSHVNLKLATKLKDSVGLLRSHHSLAFYYDLQIVKDSSMYHYYKALKLSEKLEDSVSSFTILFSLGQLKQDFRDYVDAENIYFNALNKLKLLPKENVRIFDLVNIYSQIGLNSRYLKLYDKSIEYYNKALEVIQKISKNDNDIAYIKNRSVATYVSTYIDKESEYLFININMAETYKDKKDYKKSLSIYNKLLKKSSPFNKDSLLKKDPLSYAAVTNNIANNLFLSKSKNTNKIKSLFNEAYTISDSLNATYEIVTGGNDMAEFYYAIGKKDSALIFSKRSYNLAKNIKDFHEVFRSLHMLSKLEEGETGKQYLYEHIRLNDSLLDIERASRNKFARIQYETDNYIRETERLSTQNTLLIIGGLMVVFILGLLYVIKIQYSKNEKLRFVSEQQVANEEIYALMLRQQAKVEEGRLQERNDIAEELHDGILNRLTGSRLGLEFLTYEEDYDKSQYAFFMNEFQNIERDVRDLSHSLKNTKLNLNGDFISIIKNYLKPLGKLHKITCKVKHDKTIYWEDINDIIKVNMYRIIQEATQNTIKHAKANSIIIRFLLIENQLKVEYNDNGTGFNQQKPIKGIGLKNIVSRVNKLKGKLHINSEVDKGTTLTINIPL